LLNVERHRVGLEKRRLGSPQYLTVTFVELDTAKPSPVKGNRAAKCRFASFASLVLLIVSGGAAESSPAVPLNDVPRAQPVTLEPGATALQRVFLAAPTAAVVRFAAPPEDRVFVASEVETPATEIRRQLLDPANLRRAVPAFVKVDAVEEHPRPDAGAPDRLLAWELEIPLWNLKGRLWSRATSDAIHLDFVSGAFAPGKLVFHALPVGPGRR